MILPLVYYGNSKLRSKCLEVKEITEEIKQLCLDMVETMDANNGVGLAAIQVGKFLRITVIRPVLDDEKGEAYLGDAEIYINPKLSSPAEDTVKLPEGCLSLPGLHEEVERPISIHIEALDIDGNKISKEIKGYKAREIMHENDHLNGVLFIDRLPAKKRKEIEPALKEIKAKYN
ncbi:MAG: Peptide deformylase [Candidatus Anoxychlamydiales bacterium]|nr:Peptide deformylase [Candidatus Anoxychlamydiales bacterium]NGX40785.1 Peptide deformylase [Candidatus Anoxychlamydiales bacterium]HEU64330.1 peptide deformylase [Chlamydiota bacterium]